MSERAESDQGCPRSPHSPNFTQRKCKGAIADVDGDLALSGGCRAAPDRTWIRESRFESLSLSSADRKGLP